MSDTASISSRGMEPHSRTSTRTELSCCVDGEVSVAMVRRDVCGGLPGSCFGQNQVESFHKSSQKTEVSAQVLPSCR